MFVLSILSLTLTCQDCRHWLFHPLEEWPCHLFKWLGLIVNSTQRFVYLYHQEHQGTSSKPLHTLSSLLYKQNLFSRSNMSVGPYLASWSCYHLVWWDCVTPDCSACLLNISSLKKQNTAVGLPQVWWGWRTPGTLSQHLGPTASCPGCEDPKQRSFHPGYWWSQETCKQNTINNKPTDKLKLQSYSQAVL